ncbi:MAG: dihydrolipoyl dehydrogenase [Clostridiales Family XIII bacterium]|jgi:dihydrolipoamide dehydrogenase|nr:dihydrolipoyl dehydrogenase [Clostridiales Family XIII bacterium]
MAKEIIMPKNGMDMKEGVLVKWLVSVGDYVEKGDPVMEIETDKVTMESEAPASGTVLALYAEEGETVPVLSVMGYLGEKGEQVPERPAENLQSDAAPLPPAPSAEKVPPAVGDSHTGAENARFDFDVAVIGGGPAGYTAAIRVAQRGGRAVLFERGEVGGTCLNRGCIPAKTYLKTAEYLHCIEHAKERGILLGSGASVDMERVRGRKDEVVGTLVSGVASLLRSNGIEVVRGDASLCGPQRIRCGGREYSAGKIILCGGSKPSMPPIPGICHEEVWSSDDAFSTKDIPKRLAILGGGVVGCELAAAFHAFGSSVTIIETLPRLVANMDESVSDALRKAFETDGIAVLTDTRVNAVRGAAGGGLEIEAGGSAVFADKLLVATGRIPVLDCLGSMKDSIAIRGGAVVVDERLMTSIENVYAAGDICGGAMLAHAAFRMADVAAIGAMGGDARIDLGGIPGCVYTMPEAAGIGLTEKDARERYQEAVSVGMFPFAANGRALASGSPEGFVKVIVGKEYGELLGVHIVGGCATETIMEPAALMRMEVTAHEVVGDIVHAHPTFAEAFMEACADALGQSVHLPKRG